MLIRCAPRQLVNRPIGTAMRCRSTISKRNPTLPFVFGPAAPELADALRIVGGDNLVQTSGSTLYLSDAFWNRVSQEDLFSRPTAFCGCRTPTSCLYPLTTILMLHVIPDQKVFFALEEKLLRAFLCRVWRGVVSVHARFVFLNAIVRSILERHKQGGAAVEKFEMAYLRHLGHR